MNCAKTAEQIDLPFGLWTRVGRRKHKFNRIRQVAPTCHHGRTDWRNLANTTEPSICGGHAALYQITLTTCYLFPNTADKLPSYSNMTHQNNKKLKQKKSPNSQRSDDNKLLYNAAVRALQLLPKSQIPLRYLVRSWLRTCSELVRSWFEAEIWPII